MKGGHKSREYLRKWCGNKLKGIPTEGQKATVFASFRAKKRREGKSLKVRALSGKEGWADNESVFSCRRDRRRLGQFGFGCS